MAADELDGTFRVEGAAGLEVAGLEIAAEVLGRERIAARGHQLLEGAFEDDLAAEFAGSGAEVDDVVGGAHDVGVVFDHQDGVAEVAQFVEDADQARGVARVQADGRFVEDVTGSD